MLFHREPVELSKNASNMIVFLWYTNDSTVKILNSLEFSNVRLWSKAPDWRSVKDVYWKLTYWEIFSTHRSQIPHSETNPHTAHHRADMHQSEPTQKYSLPTHVQGLRKVLHWKHNIPTRSRERTFDQRQFVREKATHNLPSQHPKHRSQDNYTRKRPR